MKQNVSSPFKNLELLAEKTISKARSVMVEVAKLEPNCLYVASVTSSLNNPLKFAVLRVLTASAPRFRELSAPESSYFLKAEETAERAVDTDSFSSQGSLENHYALPTPVRNDPMRGSNVHGWATSGSSDWQGSRDCEEFGDIELPPFLQDLIRQCSSVNC